MYRWLAIEREDTMGRESSRNIIRVYHNLKDFLETQEIEYNYIEDFDPDQPLLIIEFQTEEELNMFLLMFSEHFRRYELES